MKAIIYINYDLFKHNLKIIIISLISIIIYCQTQAINQQQIVFDIILAINNTSKCFSDIMINFIINFSYIYFYVYIYKYYMTQNKEITFLRINIKKWNLSIMISYIIICIILTIINIIAIQLINVIIYKRFIYISLLKCIGIFLSKIVLALATLLILKKTNDFSIILIGCFIIVDYFFNINSLIYINKISLTKITFECITIITLILLNYLSNNKKLIL